MYNYTYNKSHLYMKRERDGEGDRKGEEREIQGEERQRKERRELGDEREKSRKREKGGGEEGREREKERDLLYQQINPITMLAMF